MAGLPVGGTHRAEETVIMRSATPLEHLLSQSLRNLFSAETHRLRGVRRAAPRIASQPLRELFISQAELGELHLARLDLVAHRHRFPLTESGAHGMAGIIAAFDDPDPDSPSSPAVDLHHGGNLLKAGAYLRAAYRATLLLTERPGWTHAAASLRANLEEEEEYHVHLATMIRSMSSVRPSPSTVAMR